MKLLRRPVGSPRNATAAGAPAARLGAIPPFAVSSHPLPLTRLQSARHRRLREQVSRDASDSRAEHVARLRSLRADAGAGDLIAQVPPQRAVRPTRLFPPTVAGSDGLTGEDVMELVVELMEAERRRIAYNIHDGLAQVVVSVYQRVESLAAARAGGSPEDQAQWDQARALARRTICEVRRVIADLVPTVLDDFGLEVALAEEIQALRNDGWTIDFDNPGLAMRLPQPLEVTLFRIAQEALANARKYAGTTSLFVSLRRTESRVRLEVHDRGCGFDATTIAHHRYLGEQIGLNGIRDRITLLGGSWSITSHPGEGTRIAVEVPLDPQWTLPLAG